ncbi:MAG: hypothetical protein DRP57_08870 [Spirochaetes bacterium]|nr:MAG: hypothetical protein DRP57_08870 [Spirochaetota bacterium]
MYGVKNYMRTILIIIIIWSVFSCGKINFNKKNIPDEALSEYLSAKRTYEKGDFAAALQKFKLIYEKYSGFYQAGFMYGKSQFFLGDAGNAGLIFKKLYTDFPAFTDAGFWQARALYEAGKLKNSEELLKRLLSFQPDNPEMLYMLALISLEQDRIPDAISFLRKASLFGERFALVYFQLGRLYDQLGLEDESLKELSRAKVLLPKDDALYTSIKLIEEKISKGSR